MSINKACKMLGYARSTFFECRNNEHNKAEKDKIIEEFVLTEVRKIRAEMPRIGGKKLYYLINKNPERQAYKFGRKRFFEILQMNNLLIKRRKKRVNTTDNCLWRGQYPDLIVDIIPTRPEQIWVSDITYFRTKTGFIYGHLITDAYSKKLIGFKVAKDMKATTTLLAAKMAVKNRVYQKELIHHSDRGLQYLSSVYTKYLKKNGIKISVTQNSSPYENAVAERINGILKDEFGFDGVFDNLKQAEKQLEKAVYIYNEKRPHWSNHFLTPNEMHQQDVLEIITWEIEKSI
jgi:transposase InsO family protein